MLAQQLEHHGISLRSMADGSYKTTCPECSHTRKKPHDPCLSVTVEGDKAVWNCHNCGFAGAVGGRNGHQKEERKPYARPKYDPSLTDLPEKVVAWFAKRRISQQTLAEAKVGYGPFWFSEDEPDVMCIQFPFHRGGEVVNIKYRDGRKQMRQAKNPLPCFYGHDEARAVGGDELVIVEGEIDCLTLRECGIKNVVSVPNGAPNPGTKNYAKKFEFLDHEAEFLAGYKTFVLCVDDDGPGQTLAAELARRLDIEKCKRITYPGGCKDINDVLVKYSSHKVRGIIEGAEHFPIQGILSVQDLAAGVSDLYDQGTGGVFSTGWPTLDAFYRVKPGQLTIVTGTPSHGKSTYIDAMMVNLYRNNGWRFLICSPENYPVERHVSSILEKIVLKRFDMDGVTVERMTKEEVWSGMDMMRDNFRFISLDDDDLTVDHILGLARQAVKRWGINGLVLDPWNTFEHKRPTHMSETEYVSQQLSRVIRFARTTRVHIWIIVHPTKILPSHPVDNPSGLPVTHKPTLRDCSGSAHWYNKADMGLTVYRGDASKDAVEIMVTKARFRECGGPGSIMLGYNRDTGTYHEMAK